MDNSDATFRQKQAAVQASLDAQDEITIYAAIGADGPRSNTAGDDPHWPLCLDVIAWRIPEGPVQRGDLLFDQRVTADELAALAGAIKTESLIAFRAKLCECSHFGDTRARLLSLLPPPQDDKLAALLHTYSNPVLMTDPVLGKLVFDKSSEVFAGTINWMGKDIRITLGTDEHANVGDTVATAKMLLSDMPGWTHQVNRYAAVRLLALKNEGWLGEDEAPVTREQFIERMQLDSISVEPGGEFIFWHLDGGLFFGHYIQICGSLDEGLTDADIPG